MGVVVSLWPAGPGDLSEALRISHDQPARARAIAQGTLDSARCDGVAAAQAERVLGLAARGVDDLDGARAHLRRAIELAAAAGLPELAAATRRSLAIVLARGGEVDAALAEIELAAPAVQGVDAVRLRTQRAFILQRLGRLDEALQDYRWALVALRRHGDPETEAKVLMNRGILHGYRGQLRAAEADLRGAERRHVQLGNEAQVAEVRHNLGFVAARRGDVAAALQWYERSETDLRALGIVHPAAMLDRCEALLAVRLVEDACTVGRRAASELQARGMNTDLAEARLMLSHAVLMAGDTAESARLAEAARDAFRDQRRPAWAALAGHAVVRAAATAGSTADAAMLLENARRSVADLDRAGWVVPAMDARIIAAGLALRLGRVEEATTELARVGRARRRGPAELRARSWHAVALLRHACGDSAGADRALRAGTRVLAQHQATLGATELRVQVGGQAEALGRFGLQLALESGRASRVLAWAERGRAGALRARPARPPADIDLAGRLVELRQLAGRLEAAGFAGEGTAPLLRQQAALEGTVRRMAWLVPASAAASPVEPPNADQLSAALGGRALVELVAHDGRYHAVVISGGKARLRSLGAILTVQSEVDALRFAVARLARSRGSSSSRAAAAEAVAHAASTLDGLLLRPLAGLIGDRPLVIVPTGALHALPWPTLPSCRGRELTLCPSATLWLRAVSAPPPASDAPTVLVAGPGLDHGPTEVRALSLAYPGASTFQGDAATTGSVTRAVDGAGLVHMAAHGRFRADNPLFSSVRLADGPLTVYDLEALNQPPARLVLSACDAGLSSVRPGDELMGLASALVSLGSQTLVASVVPVPDEVTARLMVDFHRRLADGASPGAALAAAQVGDHGEDGVARTAGFVCFGAA